MEKLDLRVLHDIAPFYHQFLDETKNIVIGGSFALALHGVVLHKQPEDVDLVLYSPNLDQIAKLTGMKPFCLNNNQVPKYERRSYKFNVSGVFTNKPVQVDLLLDNGSVPEDLLCINFGGTIFYIQSVEGVFEARRKYIKGERWIRVKDHVSTQQLKQLNFNM